MNIQKIFLSKMANSRLFSTSVVRASSEEQSKSNLAIRERSLNRVELIGRVGNDPKIIERPLYESQSESNQELKSKSLILFSLATNELMPNRSMKEPSDPRFRTDWHRICVVYPPLQESVKKYVRKGDRIHLTGRLHYDYLKDSKGLPRIVSSIVADDLIYLAKPAVDEEFKETSETKNTEQSEEKSFFMN
jgi:single-strand DNA-binding protein